MGWIRGFVCGGRMLRHWMVGGCCIALALVCGCHREEKIENVPVEDVPVSSPPSEEDGREADSMTDSQGVRLADADVRIYGAVVPKGSEVISTSDREQRLIAPNMDRRDIERFLNKYFPYQKIDYYRQTQIFEVHSQLKEEFEDGGIVPDLNPLVFKPETPVFITVFYSKHDSRYEWIYHNPTPTPAMIREMPEDNEVRYVGGRSPLEDYVSTPQEFEKICVTCREMKAASDPNAGQVCEQCLKGGRVWRHISRQKFQETARRLRASHTRIGTYGVILF